MAAKFKIAHLPRDVREQIERLWRDGAFTLDQLLAWVNEAAPEGEISRSGLGRYVAQYSATFEKIREAQEVAAHCVAQLGENPRGEVGTLLCQMLSALGGEEQVNSKELFFLSTALKNLASAEKINVDRELKLREKLAEKKAAVAEKVEKLTRSGGLSVESSDAIRKAILEIEL
jgi:Protein of unknown function (DUF3486)